MPEKITVPIPKPKKRIGVMPTRREKDRSKEIPRRDKHRKRQDGQEYGGPPG